MNFLDTFDIARSATPISEQVAQQPSLNEEVNQVIGQLGRFWGGFRKQVCSFTPFDRKLWFYFSSRVKLPWRVRERISVRLSFKLKRNCQSSLSPMLLKRR